MERLLASDAQMRLWSAAALDPEPCTYHIPICLKWRGPLSLSRLRAALESLLQAHEILRTAFVLDGRHLYQEIDPSARVNVQLQRCASDALSSVLQDLAARPMDLLTAPLLDVHVLHHGPIEQDSVQDPTILWVLHHLIADGASTQILQQDLVAALRGELRVDPEALSYADLSEWEREHWDSPAGQAQIDALCRYLDQSPSRMLGSFAPVQSSPGKGAQILRKTLPKASSLGVQALQRRGYTPLMVFGAGLFAYLAECGAGSDLCVGTTLARRQRAELARVVGPVANTVVLRQPVGKEWTRQALLDAFRQACLGAHERAEVPVEKVLAKRAGPRNSEGHPLFDIMFLVQPPVVHGPALFEVKALLLPQKSAKFPLTVSWIPDASGLWTLQLEAQPGRFDAAGLSAFAQRYFLQIEALLEDPAKRLELPELGRASLPPVEHQASMLEAGRDDAPHWPALCRALGRLLHRDTLSVDQDFFAVGGDSIVAMQLVQALSDEGLELRTDDVFSRARLGDIADQIRLKDAVSTPWVTAQGWRGPPSPLAAGMVYHSQKAIEQENQTPDLYIQQLSVQLEGPFDEQRWRRAFGAVIDRHASLRSVFTVDPEAGLQLSFADATAVHLPMECSRAPDRRDSLEFSIAELAQLRAQLAGGCSLPWMRLDVKSDGQRSVFAWTYHHALLDGWSAALVLDELLTFYAQPELVLEPYQDPYPTYLEWVQNQSFDQEWWTKHLQGLRTEMAPPVQHSAGARPNIETQGVTIPSGVASALRSAAQREKQTLACCLLAAWAVARGRYSASSAWAWGTTVSGRDIEVPEVAKMVGLLMNSLPLRVELCPGKSLRAWLGELFAQQQALSARSYTPLAKLGTQVLGGRSCFDELWVFENYPVAAKQDIPGLSVKTLGFHDAAHYPLCAVASDHETMSLRVSFDARRYTPLQVGHWLESFVQILERWAQCPDWERPLGALWVQGALREAVPGRRCSDPRARLLEIARDRGHAPALVDRRGTMSYAQLFGTAQALVQHQGLGPGQRVVLCAEPGRGYVVGALACRLAGATYVPIDPRLPAARIQALAERAGADKCWGVGGCDLCAVVQELQEGPHSVSVAAHAWHPHALAYAIYTSGSSGQPKLVGVSEQGLEELCAWHHVEYGTSAGQRVASLAGVGFDASVWDLWPALGAGATIYIADADLRKDVSALRAWLIEQRIQDVFVPTAMVHRWAEEEWPQGPSLLRIRTGGEALRKLPSLPPYPLINHYGPTEASVVATFHEVDPKALRGAASIGVAAARAEVEIVDPAGFDLQGEGIGEIYIGGPGADNVYLDDPRATALAFRPCPHGVGARRYRSGDLARRDAQGEFHYAGRIDRQVQNRGVRIEPGEIEAVLVQDPKLSQVSVVVDARHAALRLYAVLVPHGEWSDADQVQLEARARAQLPVSMQPCAYRCLDQLILRPSGKVDHAALLDLDWQTQSEATAVKGAAGQTLLAIWQSLLPEVPNDVGANFFALGGDSIIAVQMLARACARGLSLRTGDVEQAPTIAGLVALHESRDQVRPGSVAPGEQDDALLRRLAAQLSWGRDLREVYTAPPLAAGMLFVAKADATAPERYLESLTLQVGQPLNTGALTASFAQLVGETLTLCTGYRFDPEQGALLLLADPHSVAQRASEAIVLTAFDNKELALQQARQALENWEQPLLLRAVVRSNGSEGWELTVLFAHVILDGWSTGRLLARWLELYRHAQCEEQAPVRTVGDLRSYWRWAQSQDLDALKAFWEPELSGIACPSRLRDIAVLHPQVGPQSAQWEMPDALRASLQAVAKARAVTPSSLCQAAFALTLSRRLRQSDLCFASTVSVRPPELAQVESMVGLLINTVVTRVQVDPYQRAGDFVDALHQKSAQRQAHAAMPLSTALAMAGHPSRQGQSEGLLDCLFVYENYPRWDNRAVEEEDVGAVVLLQSEHRTHYALSLTVLAHQNFALRWGFDGSCLDHAWVFEFYQDYLESLEALCSASNPMLGALGQTEHAKTTTTNDSATPTPLWPAFAHQVQTQGQAIAVVDGQGRYSYQELGEHVQAMRHRLRCCGVVPGQVVVIATGPNVHSVAALWAIWACGAAFWVVDPQTPAQRLASMLDKVKPCAWIGELPSSLDLSSRKISVVDPESPVGHEEHQAFAPPAAAHPSALAYVIYTSGSTGRPKAVLVGHDSLRRHQAWVRQARALDAKDVVLHKTPLSFDGALWEVLGPLCVGARCIIAPPSTRLDPRALWSVITDHGVSVMQFVPSWIQTLVSEATREMRVWPDSLRLVALGGERVEPELVRAIFARRADQGAELLVHNVYGPSECTVDVTAYAMIEQKKLEGRVPVGQSVAGARNHLLDHQGRACASHCVGELFIGGTALAWGYADDPRQTALRFVPDPDSPIAGGRMYRSGDLMVRDAEGVLTFVGRSDDQVKVDGHRIDLLEVEAHMRGVAQACGLSQVAAVLGKENGRAQLQAVYRVLPEQHADLDAMRQALAHALPKSHQPRRWVELSSWPQTASGKTDRIQLAKLACSAFPASVTVGGPSLGSKGRIVEVWTAVFGAPNIDLDSDFFALGGDSITCMQLVGRLREQGLECSPRMVFENPRLGDLAAAICGASPDASPELWQPIDVEPLELCPIQAAFEARGLAVPEHYNQSVLVSLHHEVAPQELSRWLEALVDHYPVLRASEAMPGTKAWPVEHLDLRGQAQVDALRLAAFSRAHQSLSRHRGPLARAVYLQLDDGPDAPAQLMLVIHHWVVDAVSWRNLLGTLSALVNGGSLPTSIDEGMQQWKQALGVYCQSPAAQRECEYWSFLAHCDAPLQLHRGQNPCLVHQAKALTVTLEKVQTQALLEFAAREPRVALTALLLTALGQSVWEAFLGDAPADALWIAVEGHGRESHRLGQVLPGLPVPELSSSVGWFTSIYPVAADRQIWGGGLDRDSIMAVHEQMNAAPLAGAAFGALRYFGSEEQKACLEALPQPQVSWNYLGQMDAQGQDPWVKAVQKDPAQGQAGENARGYALDASAYIQQGQLHLVWSYCGANLEDATVRAAFEGWVGRLRELACGGQTMPEDLPDLDELAGLLDLDLLDPGPDQKESR